MGLARELRRGQGPVWGTVKRWIKFFLTAHVPITPLTKPFARVLYTLHVGIREGAIYAARFFWNEPLFRAQCESVGEGFVMEQLPYITGFGRIVIGNSVRLSGKSSIGFGSLGNSVPELVVGDETFVGHDCQFSIAKSVRIGRHCLLASGLRVADFDGHPLDAALRRTNAPPSANDVAPVQIGDDVWIGGRVTILKGATIGDRAIIGAGTVVTKDVPPDVVFAGNPGKFVKRLASGSMPQAGAQPSILESQVTQS